MLSKVGIRALTCLLFVGLINATPFYGDFMHRLTRPSLHRTLLAPIPLAPLPPLEPIQPLASERVASIWTQPPIAQQQPQQHLQPLPLPLQQQQFANAPLLPHFSSFSSEGDTEFVPLEHQQGRNDPQQASAQKPFNVDAVTSEVNGNTPGLFFQQSFPFFGTDLFNSFGGFGFGEQEPWWKGPNVCTEKQEDESTDAAVLASTDKPTDADENERGLSPIFGQFHFSVNSCNEKPNKHVCSKVINQNGKKKTLTITRQCCYGYGRSRNADYNTPCEKIEIKDVEAAATELGGKQFIANAKNSGELGPMVSGGNKVTIFVPTDSAFNEYRIQQQSDNNMVEPKIDDAMKDLYKLHTIDNEVFLEDMINEKLLKTKMDGQNIRINMYQLPAALGLEPYRYAANCVPIEKYDKQTEQGLVHTVNGVLQPVTKTIMDIIRARADMSIMRTVLEKTKLSEMLEGNAPVTIFVPTDDAFDKLEPHLRRALKEGKGCASNILKNHILDLTFCSVASVPGTKTTAYNLLGEPLVFNRTNALKAKNLTEVEDLVGEQSIMINGAAKIIESDIMGTNGVLHVLDTILPTQSALPLTSLMQEKNLTLFKRLLEASGYDNEFDDLDNVTVFVPTDKALQSTEWAELLRDSPDLLKNNADLMEFVNYHVVKPMIKTCDLSERSIPTVSGANVRLNLYSTHALFSDIMNRATVNCARLVHFDDESCGSVVHQIDRPLTPPKNTLLKSLETNPNYSKFLELVRKANLTHLLSNATDSYTLLVPKNDVFEELQSDELKLGQTKEELQTLVRTHIVNDVVCCAGIIPSNWPFVRSIEAINGQHLRITRDRRPKIENAGVTKCDIIATNGIVHEINDIIVPRRTQRRPVSPVYPLQNSDFDTFF